MILLKVAHGIQCLDKDFSIKDFEIMRTFFIIIITIEYYLSIPLIQVHKDSLNQGESLSSLNNP